MATMGHEVRTPLNAILGTAELLELGELSERVRGSVQTIRRSGESLSWKFSRNSRLRENGKRSD